MVRSGFSPRCLLPLGPGLHATLNADTVTGMFVSQLYPNTECMLRDVQMPRQRKPFECLHRGRGLERTRKHVCLNGPGRVAGGVFRCHLSCDSRQPSLSNCGCGVPRSAGRGALGPRLPGGVEGRAVGGWGGRGLGSAAGRGPLRRQAPTSQRPPWGEWVGTALPPLLILLRAHFVHEHVLFFHFYTNIFYSISRICWQAAGLGLHPAPA